MEEKGRGGREGREGRDGNEGERRRNGRKVERLIVPFDVVISWVVSSAFSRSVRCCTNQCKAATPTPAAVIISVSTLREASNATSSLAIFLETSLLTTVIITPDKMGPVLPMREMRGYMRLACVCGQQERSIKKSNS